jgi:hypothetical protein
MQYLYLIIKKIRLLVRPSFVAPDFRTIYNTATAYVKRKNGSSAVTTTLDGHPPEDPNRSTPTSGCHPVDLSPPATSISSGDLHLLRRVERHRGSPKTLSPTSRPSSISSFPPSPVTEASSRRPCRPSTDLPWRPPAACPAHSCLRVGTIPE